jgi:probable F420-dependent oxidoreductase
MHVPQWGGAATRTGVLDVARAVEDAGLDSIWVGDHVVVPAVYESRYPYRAEGPPFQPDEGFLDALTLLAVIAGATEKVQVGTSVLVAPLRSPLVLAKIVSTIDVLSNGRVILGLGSGWLKEEFDAIGVDFETRGTRLTESIEILKLFWASGSAGFNGRHFSFEEVHCEPLPIQHGGPPVWMGGTSPAALRRIAQIGDGWIAVGSRPERISAGKAKLEEYVRAASREMDDISIAASVGLPADDDIAIERLVGLGSLGVEHVILGVFSQSPGDLCRLAIRFAERIMPTVLAET